MQNSFEQNRTAVQRKGGDASWPTLSTSHIERAIEQYFFEFPPRPNDHIQLKRRRQHLITHIRGASTWHDTYPEIKEAETLYTELARQKVSAGSNAAAVLLAAYGRHLSVRRTPDSPYIVPPGSGKLSIGKWAAQDFRYE